MNILFVTEQFPYPLHDGGNLRTYHLLRHLARGHTVHLMAHEPKQDASEALERIRPICPVTIVEKPRRMSQVTYNLLRRARSLQSLFVLKNWSERLLRAVDDELEASHYDAIHFNHLDTACFSLARSWPQLKVFDSHNCLSNMAAQVVKESNHGIRRLVYRHEASALRRVERAVLSQVDLTLACSDCDAKAFTRICGTGRCEVIPNGVDTSFFTSDTEELPAADSPSLVFTGAMNYYPNEQAAVYFCREVLPKLVDREFTVHFVGKDPTPAVTALHDGQRVFVTGRVADVRPYVQRAQVFIVPLRHGSGTRLKILEAFAMGKAVVSSSLGAEGIPVRDGETIELADDAISFAAKIRRLLDDGSRRARLGRQARCFVEQSYDWQTIGGRLVELYTALRCNASSAGSGRADARPLPSSL